MIRRGFWPFLFLVAAFPLLAVLASIIHGIFTSR